MQEESTSVPKVSSVEQLMASCNAMADAVTLHQFAATTIDEWKAVVLQLYRDRRNLMCKVSFLEGHLSKVTRQRDMARRLADRHRRSRNKHMAWANLLSNGGVS